MIKTWKHKGLRKFFETGNRSGINPAHETRLKIVLQRLNAATKLEDMNTPSLKLHKLSGNFKAFYSVTVNANWRVIFRYNGPDAEDVDYIDYH